MSALNIPQDHPVLLAKRGAGTIQLDNLKLFPCYYFTNFCNFDGMGNQNPILKCDKCGDLMSEYGNGSYYTAYVIIHSPEQVTVACGHNCMPEGCLDYHHQVYGHRKPIKLPAELAADPIARAVFSEYCSGYRSYELKNYPKGITGADFDRLYDSDGFGGGSLIDCEPYKWRERRGHTYTIASDVYMKHNKVVLKRGKLIEIINTILASQKAVQMSFF